MLVTKLLILGKYALICLMGLLALLALVGLVTHKKLPDNSQRTPSQHLPVNPDGLMARHLLPQMAAHPGQSGLLPLVSSRDAFAARLALAGAAQQSLDLQYYIWHDDVSGRLLMQALVKAADRGVRVRLLLDDHTMAGMDPLIAALDAHERIEVRLFNPYMQRGLRPLGYLSDFWRLNRRMHNKSMTADSLITIVGGRNIGDEYFQATSGVMFADLDVAAVGPAAQAVSADFDRYWNSEPAYPAGRIIGSASPAALDTAPAQDEATQSYLRALAQLPLARQLREGGVPLVWAPARVVSDAPAKALGQAQRQDTLLAQIGPVMQAAEKQLLIVSPYFVPTRHGADMLGNLAAGGKEVVVLTNTLAANDVTVVHSGYAKYRKDLLKSGVRLHEIKPDATVKPENQRGILDSSGASLHAKTFAVDGRYLYVGSFNLDPRSAIHNTEMGLLIDSPKLAAQMVQGFETGKDANTYAVTLDGNGRLHWTTGAQGQQTVVHEEPQSTFLQRAQVWIASRLPVEWLL